jgi:hypothetical protein
LAYCVQQDGNRAPNGKFALTVRIVGVFLGPSYEYQPALSAARIRAEFLNSALTLFAIVMVGGSACHGAGEVDVQRKVDGAF